MSVIQDVVTSVLTSWNKGVKKMGNEFHFEIKAQVRKKKYYLNKKDFIEKDIAELLLLYIGEKTMLLHRNEMYVPPKRPKEPLHALHRELLDQLYHDFLYESIGTYCASTKALIEKRDYSEYDIENDRLVQDDSAIGMVVQTLVDGEFYKAKDEFDVFIDLDGEYYNVFTEHSIARNNNGIYAIKKSDCMIVVPAKKKIILLDK